MIGRGIESERYFLSVRDMTLLVLNLPAPAQKSWQFVLFSVKWVGGRAMLYQQEANTVVAKDILRPRTTDHSSLKYNLMFALALTGSCVHFQENTATPTSPHTPPTSPHLAYRRSWNKRQLLPSSGSIILELSPSLPLL